VLFTGSVCPREPVMLDIILAPCLAQLREKLHSLELQPEPERRRHSVSHPFFHAIKPGPEYFRSDKEESS
jgi:hypothetical protein